MKKLVALAATAMCLGLGTPAMASLVNVNTNNTFHPNNDLRCSGQCDLLSNNSCSITGTLDLK